MKAEIKKANSINDIFQVLTTDCCSFINVGIFQSIINKYKINTDSDEDLRYSEHLKSYLKSHKISEFIMINPKLQRLPESSEELMILKFNIALPSKITKVLDLKCAIAKILGIRSHALRLIGIEDGCVVATFLIPATVAKYVFASGLTAEQEAEIRALSVLWLKCGDYKLEEIPSDASSRDLKETTLDNLSELKCKSRYNYLLVLSDFRHFCFMLATELAELAELEHGDTTDQECSINKTKSRKYRLLYQIQS